MDFDPDIYRSSGCGSYDCTCEVGPLTPTQRREARRAVIARLEFRNSPAGQRAWANGIAFRAQSKVLAAVYARGGGD